MEDKNTIDIAPFTLLLDERKLTKKDQEIVLTPKEFAIIKLLAENANKAISRDEILTNVWGQFFVGDLKIVDVNIRRIRQKSKTILPTRPSWKQSGGTDTFGGRTLLMKGIRSRLVFYFGMILLLIVLLLEGLFYWAVHTYYFGTATEALETRSTTFTNFINKYATGYRLKDKARYILENVSSQEYAKIEVLDLNGKVILNSYGFQTGELVQTSDVMEAIRGQKGLFVGRTPQSRERVIAVSNPLTFGSEYVGVLRYTISAEPLYQAVNRIALYGLGVGAGVVLLAFALSLLMAKRIVDPIEDLTNAAKQMAEGNFTARAPKRYDDEVGTLADTFNYMAAEIGKNEKLKNDFISSVSHELRTPLTSIKGWGETLLSGGLEEPEETMLGLEVISKETDRLIGLVEELLDFSKFQSGEMKLSRELLDLREILDDMHVQFAIRAQEKQIDFQLALPSAP